MLDEGTRLKPTRVQNPLDQNPPSQIRDSLFNQG